MNFELSSTHLSQHLLITRSSSHLNVDNSSDRAEDQGADTAKTAHVAQRINVYANKLGGMEPGSPLNPASPKSSCSSPLSPRSPREARQTLSEHVTAMFNARDNQTDESQRFRNFATGTNVPGERRPGSPLYPSLPCRVSSHRSSSHRLPVQSVALKHDSVYQFAARSDASIWQPLVTKPAIPRFAPHVLPHQGAALALADATASSPTPGAAPADLILYSSHPNAHNKCESHRQRPKVDDVNCTSNVIHAKTVALLEFLSVSTRLRQQDVAHAKEYSASQRVEYDDAMLREEWRVKKENQAAESWYKSLNELLDELSTAASCNNKTRQGSKGRAIRQLVQGKVIDQGSQCFAIARPHPPKTLSKSPFRPARWTSHLDCSDFNHVSKPVRMNWQAPQSQTAGISNTQMHPMLAYRGKSTVHKSTYQPDSKKQSISVRHLSREKDLKGATEENVQLDMVLQLMNERTAFRNRLESAAAPRVQQIEEVTCALKDVCAMRQEFNTAMKMSKPNVVRQDGQLSKPSSLQSAVLLSRAAAYCLENGERMASSTRLTHLRQLPQSQSSDSHIHNEDHKLDKYALRDEVHFLKCPEF